MLICCTTFKSCQRCDTVATFVTLEIWINCKVLIAYVRWLVMGHYAGHEYLRRHMRAHTAPGWCSEHVCYGIGITKYTDKFKTCALWLWSFFMCFFNAPKKLPKSQSSQEYKFPFVMYVFNMLPKKLPKSEHFPHWRQLCFIGTFSKNNLDTCDNRWDVLWAAFCDSRDVFLRQILKHRKRKHQGFKN